MHKKTKDLVFELVAVADIFEDDKLTPTDEYKMLWEFACDLRHGFIEFVYDDDQVDNIGILGYQDAKYTPDLNLLMEQVQGFDETVYDTIVYDCLQYLEESKKI